MNRQIIDTCEKCRECTLFGKNLKPASTFNTGQPLHVLSGPNQELQLDFAGPILDDKGSKIFLLVAIDRFSKFPAALISKTKGLRRLLNSLNLTFVSMVYLSLSEWIMVQVLKITWCKNFALAEVLIKSSRRLEIVEAVVWLNERFRQSRENWVLQNSILISKTLGKRFNKYLRTFARVIIRCLRNHLLNCILVVNLILNGLRRVIMLSNLILQPKDWSATSLRQTRLPAKITAETGQKLFRAVALVQQFLPASNPCSRGTEMWQIVNPTRRWQNWLGRRINGRNSNEIFHQMGGKRSSRS